MNRRFRLASSSDFKRVRQSGKAHAHSLVVLHTAPSGLASTRLAVSAGRSLGSATVRNRAKRRLREAARPHLASIPPGWDLILVARAPLARASWPEVQEAVAAVLRRARLITDDRRRA
ncbi:MAG TPA: ribonuclease P protein component [Anaerolineales bacterium]|nr:ribonuclease P protein component [Anaerolineales bacterium]